MQRTSFIVKNEGYTYTITSTEVRQEKNGDEYLIGTGGFHTGYNNGDNRGCGQKSRSATVTIDNSRECLESVTEPRTCEYHLHVCAPCHGNTHVSTR